ncbi:MAG: acetylserotonin O-methyltransferase [Acidobacteria bacterium]|nr:acetylserotonin O-methyltransferase [Acidobacteriota bacterium]
MTKTIATSEASGQALVQMLTGAWTTQLVAAVARLGIPDKLAIAQPQSSDQLARAVGANAGALYRVMRALSSIGVFADVGSGQYTLTPIGERLRSDHPESMRDFFLAETDDVHRRSWSALVDAIRSGLPQPAAVFGTTVFDYYGKHEEEGQQFGRAMGNVSAMSAHGVLGNYDFSSARLIVDVGGGNGSFLRAVLQQHRQPTGIVVDLPYMESQAVASIEQDGLQNRCRFEAHDIFESVPTGGDVYLLRFILHDWNDDESRRILKTVRTAMPPTGRVLIVEMLVPETNEPGLVQMMDINMLVMTGGRERTATEYGDLCAAAGLRLVRTIATGTPFFVVEAEPV